MKITNTYKIAIPLIILILVLIIGIKCSYSNDQIKNLKNIEKAKILSDSINIDSAKRNNIKGFSVVEIAKLESQINGIIAGFTITIIVLLLGEIKNKEAYNKIWYNYSVLIFILSFFVSLLSSFLFANVSGENPNIDFNNEFLILMPSTYTFLISSSLFIMGILFILKSFNELDDYVIKLTKYILIAWISTAIFFYLITLNIAIFFQNTGQQEYDLPNLIKYGLFSYIIFFLICFFTYMLRNNKKIKSFIISKIMIDRILILRFFYSYIILTVLIISFSQIFIQDFETRLDINTSLNTNFYFVFFYIIFMIFISIIGILIPFEKGEKNLKI